MNISNLTFPLTVDFSGSKYWLNGKGPYQCGEAATAFLAGEIDCEPAAVIFSPVPRNRKL